MTVRRTLRRIDRRELCIVIASLSLGFLFATWLRAPLDSRQMFAIDKRCNAAVNPRAASQDTTVPPSPPKNFIYIGVLTAQKYLSTRAVAVNRTWARTIPGKVDFYSSATSVVDPRMNLPIVRLQGVDDSYPPQKKSFLMIKYMHDNFIDKYEWFMRADDDVYVRGDKLEPFLRSINSTQRLFIGQAGLGKQEELGLLNLDTGDNFCMGGPGMIFSRETLRKVVPHISHCLKNMWSTHEDVEVGRCIKKFAEIDCTWAYEMQALFYNNYSKSDTAFTGSLDTSDVHKAITLHPIKRTPYMYRLHNYLQSTAIMDLRMKTMHLYRSILRMRQLLNEEEDRQGLSGDPHQLQSLGLPPGLLKYAPDGPEDILPWNFFGKYWYSTSASAPRKGMPPYHTKALDHVAGQVMALINANSRKVGRTIDFKEILYGYTRVVPLYGIDYVLDLLLMYHKHSKSKRFPVRRHAYLQQSFGKLEIRVDDAELRPSHPTKKAQEDSSVEKIKHGISQTLFGIHQKGDAPSHQHPHHISKLKETIHFILPLAGRLETLQRFMENFERMCLIPGENVEMIIVLFKLPEDDPSEEIENLVAKYSGKYLRAKLKVLHASGEFSRGLALDLGASQLPPDALMFFVDVDMHISPGFLTRCRLNTQRGRQVYYPVVFGQYSPEVTYGPGTKPESKLAISKETGFFRHYGYGLACLYNGDLSEAGGLDSSIIGWGLEDVDLYQKFASSNVTILRAPDPSLIHIYHPVICNPKLETKQYQMCMGSKFNQYGSSLHLVKLLEKNKLSSSEEKEKETR